VVTWEVSDIGRIVSANNQTIRWSYLITLRNTGDRPIQLERVERAVITTSTEAVGGMPTSRAFRRTLAAGSELQYSAADSWGWMNSSSRGVESLRAITAYRRFSGTDDRGQPVEIPVSVRLDPSVGQLARPAIPSRNLPPTKAVALGDMSTLVGLWRGSYRYVDTLLDVPITVTIGADGKFQVSENAPVTNHYTRTVRVKNGGLDYSGQGEHGTLTVYDLGPMRALVGEITEPGGRPGSDARLTIYLESTAPATP
jgi:hypothetical protein